MNAYEVAANRINSQKGEARRIATHLLAKYWAKLEDEHTDILIAIKVTAMIDQADPVLLEWLDNNGIGI